jgi:hypothetical protein
MNKGKILMKTKRPIAPFLLLALLAIQGVSGLVGGALLIKDPTGGALKLPIEWLGTTPFSSYFVPGIILFSVLGLFPIVALFALSLRKSWAWYASVLVGIALMMWIGVEILLIGYHSEPPLQAIYGSIGVLILLLTSKSSVKQIRQ